MSVFYSAKHLCSWAGLTSGNNESAGKKKSVRISRAGVYLKPILVQCALASLKSQKDTYFRDKYLRIKNVEVIKKLSLRLPGGGLLVFITCYLRMNLLILKIEIT